MEDFRVIKLPKVIIALLPVNRHVPSHVITSSWALFVTRCIFQREFLNYGTERDVTPLTFPTGKNLLTNMASPFRVHEKLFTCTGFAFLHHSNGRDNPNSMLWPHRQAYGVLQGRQEWMHTTQDKAQKGPCFFFFTHTLWTVNSAWGLLTTEVPQVPRRMVLTYLKKLCSWAVHLNFGSLHCLHRPEKKRPGQLLAAYLRHAINKILES